MSKKLAYAITDNNITVNFDNQTHIIPRTDALAEKLLKALREGRKDEIPDLISVAKRVEQYGNGVFAVKDGQIFVNGQLVHDVLGRKILKFQAEGLPFQPLVRFAENLQKNPSFRAVNELFQFLEKNDHPITEEGNFIAYKKVREDFKDVHTGTFDNSPGKVVEMPRNQVNENSAETCSNGLHAANFSYASGFYAGGKMLELEINPADVVSIPVDYNQAKMRVCKYKVLGVVDKEHSSDDNLRYSHCAAGCGDHDDLVAAEDNGWKECDNCGGECENGYDVCADCESCSECKDCGTKTYDHNDLCDDCEEDREAESDDQYPWEDELKK